MKRSGKLGALLGAIALAIAVAGASLSTVNAQGTNNPPPPDKSGQGVSAVHLGF